MNITTKEAKIINSIDALGDIDAMARGFQQPPNEFKPFTRWWWFGTASKEEIAREMAGIAKAGFGGVEIQTIYSALPGHLVAGYQDMDWLGDEWLDMLACAVKSGKELGLQVDLTFGTGWPFGGPHVDKEHASCKLATYSIPLNPGEQINIPIEDLVEKSKQLARIVAGRLDTGKVIVEIVDLQPRIKDGVLAWEVPGGDWILLWFVPEPTGQQVKRAAPAGGGLVLDHLHRDAFWQHARRIDSRLKTRFTGPLGDHFGAFFCDSWEVYGENWTPRFMESFKERMGYDIRGYLPILEITGIKCNLMEEHKALVNYDYKKHHADLIIEEFFEQFAGYCHASGVECRAQPYMAPTDLLRAYGVIDILEIEGFGQAGINSPYYKTLDPRLASSGAHVYGKSMVSCESFTWLKEHFTATIDDVKAEADQIILCGVNRIIYQGYAFSPPGAGVPGWQFYASIELNHTNPWWHLAGEINQYMARNSFLSRQGRPVAMLAVYLPMHDEWMGFTDIRKDLKIALRESGHLSDYDYVNDDRLLDAAHVEDRCLVIGDMCYRALVLYNVTYLPVAVARAIASIMQAGVPVFCIASVPSTVPGLKAARNNDQAMANPAFEQIRALAHRIPSITDLRAHLVDLGIAWDFTATTRDGSNVPLQYLHRTCDHAELYFIVNGSEATVDAWINVPVTGVVDFWNPLSGDRSRATPVASTIGMTTIAAAFKAKEARWMVVSKNVAVHPARMVVPPVRAGEVLVDRPWDIVFHHIASEFPPEEARDEVIVEGVLFDWTSRDATRFFSGTAEYSTTVDIPEEVVQSAARIEMDLGTVHGMPELFVNDTRYFAFKSDHGSLDVTRSIHPGKNTIHVHVTNTLRNKVIGYATAGTAWKGSYYFVNAGYKPFKAETMEPLPAGLLGPLKLRWFTSNAEHDP